MVNSRWSPRSVDGLGQAVVITGGSQSVTFKLVYYRGNLSVAQVITNAHGSGSVMLTSGELGLGVVTAQSRGLYNGTGEVAFTLPPLVIVFNEWILSSKGKGPDSKIVARFQVEHNASYNVTLTGWATEAHWPWDPEEWAIGRIEIDGVVPGEVEVASRSRIDVPFGDVLLDAGRHTLRVTITNDFNVPLLGIGTCMWRGLNFLEISWKLI